MKKILLIFFLLCLSFSANAKKGLLDFNYYYDNRDFNVFTINTMLSISPKFQYFSLTNYFNSIGTNKNLEKSSFYTEQNIRYLVLDKIIPTELTSQWVIRSSEENDILRFGFRTRISSIEKFEEFFKSFLMQYSINFHLISFDNSEGYDWQIEHVYSITPFPTIFQNRVYLAGFLDHNFSKFGENIVSEHQIGFQLINELYAVIEFKYNNYLENKKSGVGYGLEYKSEF